MKQIDNQKIRTYDECTADEKEVLDSFRKMKLMFDQARYELFSYKLTDLLEKYEGLLEMGKENRYCSAWISRYILMQLIISDF